MLNYIIENWYIILGIIAIVGAIIYFVIRFFKIPSKEQLTKVREWLLLAVTKAEAKLGGGTGKLKLRYVYDMFVGKFSWLAKVITFEQFSKLVDDALEEMRELLKNNEAIAKLDSYDLME